MKEAELKLDINMNNEEIVILSKALNQYDNVSINLTFNKDELEDIINYYIIRYLKLDLSVIDLNLDINMKEELNIVLDLEDLYENDMLEYNHVLNILTKSFGKQIVKDNKIINTNALFRVIFVNSLECKFNKNSNLINVSYNLESLINDWLFDYCSR